MVAAGFSGGGSLPGAWAGDAVDSAAVMSITVGELHDAVAFLADDALEGREAGKPGGLAAGEYLRGELEKLGLHPAGSDGFFQPFGDGYRNLLAEWPADAAHDAEIIVVGAHYDHVGYGVVWNVRDEPGTIHNGADDNASGTSALLEIAEAFTLLARPTRRKVLFAFWDAEEKGLLGSKHWVENPTRPLDKVRFLVNMDMIGRLRDDRVELYGIRSSYGLREMLAGLNRAADLRLDYSWWNRRDTDHAPFFRKNVPYLLFHTGMHEDYHSATDDTEKINVEGMEAVTRLVFELAVTLADREEPMAFRAASKDESAKDWDALLTQPKPWRDRTGMVTEDVPPPESGGLAVRIAEVRPDSPAARAGLEAGWFVETADGVPVPSSERLTAVLLLARRPAVRLTLSSADGARAERDLVLEGEPLRLGMQWQPDDAEPRGVLVTHVLVGSPAEQAGVRAGDYIFAVNGEPLSEPHRFDEVIARTESPFTLLVDRQGRLKTVTVGDSTGRAGNAAPSPPGA
ncbi:MAG: M28 family peptidase [Thermogutta sp.]|nr:M28 family peptidase [Thermogutta sp.]